MSKVRVRQMVSRGQATQEDKRLMLGLWVFLVMTLFMSFTTVGVGVGLVGYDGDATVFNKVVIDKRLRGDLYFLLHDLVLVPVFWRRRNRFLRFGFWVFLVKLVYNFGILIRLYDFDKGYSDFLNIGVVGCFLLFDLVGGWSFRLKRLD